MSVIDDILKLGFAFLLLLIAIYYYNKSYFNYSAFCFLIQR